MQRKAEQEARRDGGGAAPLSRLEEKGKALVALGVTVLLCSACRGLGLKGGSEDIQDA